MAPTQTHPSLCQSLTPELRSIAIERTQSVLLTVVRPNLNTQYGSRAPALAELRDAISAHGSESDVVLAQDFRRCVPLTDYDAYKPFIAVFEKNPCKEVEIENLLAPGLPFLLAISSATSGTAPKLFPKYPRSSAARPPPFPEPIALMLFCGYKDVREVEREPGSIVKRVPVSINSSGDSRMALGWTNIDDDESRMSVIAPGRVAPWAASLISDYKSFLVVNALFALARPDLACIGITFSTVFYDLLRHVDEGWDMLLSCIRNGTAPDGPDLSGVREVESHLRANLYANPERAAELSEIGPPFSCEGWAARVWPKLKAAMCVCSGSFASLVPTLRVILGPTILLRTPGYIATESYIATPHRPDDLDTFMLRSNNLVEFLDVTTEESFENLRQAWEVEVGKQYEIVLTTTDGLWRYRLGDAVDILGFDSDNGSPVFTFFGRTTLAIRLHGTLVPDAHLTIAIRAISPDVMQVNEYEFTTALDHRENTQTVGYFVELAGTLGPNARAAPSKLCEALATASAAFRRLVESAEVRRPTVRLVRSGTFVEYRQWKAKKMNAGPGQTKVPVVLHDETSIEWILKRVIEEL